MTIRNLLTLTAVAAVTLSGHGANEVFDFSYGIRPDVKLYDLDGLTPSPDVTFTGLKPGTPWGACDVEKNGTSVAVSTSWYKPAGKSDDWMVLPGVVAESGAELRWTARAFDRQLPDGYSVYISVTGDTPDDFDRSRPLFHVDAESTEWTDHTVALDDYAGQRVYVAFVNDSEDRDMLLIKRITLGVPDRMTLSFAGERAIAAPGEKIALKFTATSGLTQAQTIKSARCLLGDKELTLTDLGKLESGASLTFEFPDGPVAQKDVMTDVTVTVESDLGVTEQRFSLGNCRRNMVIEEATGTWCGWCVSGIVTLEEMKKKYPGQAICIAVHESGPMAIGSEYRVSGSGNPRLTLNREGSDIHPLELEEAMKPHLADLPRLAVSGEWSVSGDRAEATARIVPSSESGAIWRLSFVLLENDVHVPGDNDYRQKNEYAGGANGPMGGFEDKPKIVPAEDMWYQDVARGIFPSQKGIDCTSVTPLSAGCVSEYGQSFEIPQKVLNVDNTELYILVVDAATGSVMNGCKAERKTVGLDVPETATDAEIVATEWYDLCGRRLAGPSRGLCIRLDRYSDGTSRATKLLP